MKARKTTKLVHVGRYAAEVEVELLDDGHEWAPYLSMADVKKLDEVRLALRVGDLKAAARFGWVYELKPVAAEEALHGMSPSPTQQVTPFEGPRLRGVREHLERAQFLFDLALAQSDEKASYRLMLAAVYSCRGMIELMLEAAERQEVKGLSRDALEDQISSIVPYYALIERIRIHDFHRFGIAPPDPNLMQLMAGGPMKLTARKGGASVVLSAQGPLIKTTGGSQVRLQRPLFCRDGEFFDDQASRYVKLKDILSAFVARAPNVISEFEKHVS